MFIIRDNKGGIGSKRTVHELIVIMVGFYQMKSEIGIDKFNELTFQKQMYNICRHLNRHLLCDNLCILVQDVCRYTQNILSSLKSFPNWIILPSP